MRDLDMDLLQHNIQEVRNKLYWDLLERRITLGDYRRQSEEINRRYYKRLEALTAQITERGLT